MLVRYWPYVALFGFLAGCGTTSRYVAEFELVDCVAEKIEKLSREEVTRKVKDAPSALERYLCCLRLSEMEPSVESIVALGEAIDDHAAWSADAFVFGWRRILACGTVSAAASFALRAIALRLLIQRGDVDIARLPSEVLGMIPSKESIRILEERAKGIDPQVAEEAHHSLFLLNLPYWDAFETGRLSAGVLAELARLQHILRRPCNTSKGAHVNTKEDVKGPAHGVDQLSGGRAQDPEKSP